MNLNTLPVNSTETSHRLYATACELIETCPPELGREIALTGSVSRGVADEFSDIELNFWVDELQPQEVYLDWLRGIGVEPTPLIRNMDDGTLAIMGYRNGLFIEPAWQTFDALETRLKAIHNAEMVAPGQMTLAWAVHHAIPLREGEKIAAHKQALYPDALQKRLIEDSLKIYRLFLDNWPHDVFANLSSAKRNAKIDFMGRQVRAVERIGRILFALNRQWEPEWKWFEPESERLTIKPERLVERVYAILDANDLHASAQGYLSLLLDTLKLLQPIYQVEDLIERIKI